MKNTKIIVLILLTGLGVLTGCVQYGTLPAVPEYRENTGVYDLSSTIEVIPGENTSVAAEIIKNLAAHKYNDVTSGAHYKDKSPRSVKIITVLKMTAETISRPEGLWFDAHLIVSVRKPGISWNGVMRYESPRYFQAFAQYQLAPEETVAIGNTVVTQKVVKNLFTIDEFRKALEPAVLPAEIPEELVPQTPEGYWNISRKYQQGSNRNEYEAIRWAFLAFHAGHLQAEKYLSGNIFFTDVCGDYKRLFQLVEHFAKNGNGWAANKLGLMYDNGEGTEVNKAKAFHWYMKAAVQGIAVAQYNVGLCYEEGRGTQQNLAKSLHYYRLSAKQGYASAKTKVRQLTEQQ